MPTNQDETIDHDGADGSTTTDLGANLSDLLGDGIEQARRAEKPKFTNTKEYTDRANYRFSCLECGWEAHRIQARQSIRRIVENPAKGRCTECGHHGLEVERL